MIRHSILILALGMLVLSGCASTASTHTVVRPQAPGESKEDVVSAMSQVLGTVSDKPIGQKDLEKLSRQIQKDPETKSAVQTISNAVSGKGAPVKYCPVDGERYSPKFETCPVHHVPLKTLTD